VRNFGSHIGRAEVADEVVGRISPSCGSAFGTTCRMMKRSPRSSRSSDGYPGLSAICSHTSKRRSRGAHRARELDCLRVFGSRPGVLRIKAKEVEKLMATWTASPNLQVEAQVSSRNCRCGCGPMPPRGSASPAARSGGRRHTRQGRRWAKSLRPDEFRHDGLGVPLCGATCRDLQAAQSICRTLTADTSLWANVADVEIGSAPRNQAWEGASRRSNHLRT